MPASAYFRMATIWVSVNPDFFFWASSANIARKLQF